MEILLQDYDNRKFMIFNVSELNQIDFTQVLETDIDTVRKSVNGTKTFVKWDGVMPECVSNLTTMMEKDRIKNGNRLLPDGTFEKIQEANRIWNKENVGTSLFDTQIQAEYIRRVLAGDDPYKVTKEWAKPLPNLVADLILDPLNVFDGLGIAEKFLGGSAKLTKGITVMDELKDACESLKTKYPGIERFYEGYQEVYDGLVL